MANLNIRIDADLKKETEQLLNELGLNMSTAVNVFFRQMIRKQAIPFEIAKDIPNEETLKAIEEARNMKSDAKTYNSMSDVYKDLKI